MVFYGFVCVVVNMVFLWFSWFFMVFIMVFLWFLFCFIDYIRWICTCAYHGYMVSWYIYGPWECTAGFQWFFYCFFYGFWGVLFVRLDIRQSRLCLQHLMSTKTSKTNIRAIKPQTHTMKTIKNHTTRSWFFYGFCFGQPMTPAKQKP